MSTAAWAAGILLSLLSSKPSFAQIDFLLGSELLGRQGGPKIRVRRMDLQGRAGARRLQIT
jgi:hypothetical protein